MKSHDTKALDAFEKKIGYKFKDRSLLVTALTHSSFANESHGRAQSYERLEFLGDSILGFVTAEYLYGAFPELPEGKLTKKRASLVCEKSLCGFTRSFGAGSCCGSATASSIPAGRTGRASSPTSLSRSRRRSIWIPAVWRKRSALCCATSSRRRSRPASARSRTTRRCCRRSSSRIPASALSTCSRASTAPTTTSTSRWRST